MVSDRMVLNTLCKFKTGDNYIYWNKMIKITEYTITKYAIGKTPSDGQIISAHAFKREESQHKHKSMRRLLKYIKNNDLDRHEYYDGNCVKIIKMKKDSNFNEKGEIVYKRYIQDNKVFHKKAIQRLARYLTKIDKAYIYFGTLPLAEKGNSCYVLSSRNTEILLNEDKEKIIKNKIRGQKAAITRNLNKANQLKKEYEKTLFPNEYKSDKKFSSLIINLYKQKKRLFQYKKLNPADISTVVGKQYADISKILKEVA